MKTINDEIGLKRDTEWQCHTCQTINDSSARFCKKCGRSIWGFSNYDSEYKAKPYYNNQTPYHRETAKSSMKSSTAIALIIIVSAIITAIMIWAEMNTFKYVFTGSLSITPFLPLFFGVIISIVVAAMKK